MTSQPSSTLPAILIATGNEGIHEMRDFVREDLVQWALLRVSFGEGKLRRQRVIFLHINGSACPTMKRGQANVLTPEVQHVLRNASEHDSFHATVVLTHRAEVTPESIFERVSKIFVTDSDVDYSVQWVVQQYEQQILEAKRTRPVEERWLAQKRTCPGHESEEIFQNGRDALRAVAQPLGAWNWIFFGPDPDELPLIGGGGTSLDGMKEFIASKRDRVMFGLLRMGFGEGRLRRTKYVFVNATGEEAKAVVRGRHNALRGAMEEKLRETVTYSVAMEVKNADEFALSDVIERVRRASIVDDDVLDGDNASRTVFSIEYFREALAEEQRICNEIANSKTPTDLSIEEIVRLIHAPEGPLNWALFGPNQDWSKKGGTHQARASLAPDQPPLCSKAFRANKHSAPTGGFLAANERSKDVEQSRDTGPPVDTWLTAHRKKKAASPSPVPDTGDTSANVEFAPPPGCSAPGRVSSRCDRRAPRAAAPSTEAASGCVAS